MWLLMMTLRWFWGGLLLGEGLHAFCSRMILFVLISSCYQSFGGHMTPTSHSCTVYVII